MKKLIVAALLASFSSIAVADHVPRTRLRPGQRPPNQTSSDRRGPATIPSNNGWNINVVDAIDTGSIGSVRLVGNIAYIGYYGMVAMFDISVPTSPVKLGAAVLAGGCWDIEKEGNYLYCVTSDDFLQIVDITNLSAPSVVTTLPMSGFDLDVDGGYLYLSNAGKMEVYDLSSPTSPVLMGSCVSPNIWELVARDGYVYAGSEGLQIIDATNPSNPTTVASLTFGGGPYPLELVGNTVFMVSSYGPGGLGFYSIDVTDPGNPIILYYLFEGFDEIAVANGHAYMPNHFEDVVHVFNVEDPANPVRLPEFIACGMRDVFEIDIDNGIAAICNYGEENFYGEGDMCLIDLSNPAFPNSLHKVKSLPTAHNIVVDGDQLVVSGNNGHLSMVNRYDAGLRHVSLGTVAWIDASRVAVMGDYAYVSMCDQQGFGANTRLQAFDISNPTQPSMAGHLPSLCGRAVAAPNGNIYYATGSKIWVVDVSTPSAPVKSGEVALSANDLFANDEYLFAARNGQLAVLDLSNPTSPALVAALPLPGNAFRVHVTDSYAYLSLTTSLQIVDVSNPLQPTIVGSFPTTSGRGASVLDSHAYVSDGSFLRMLDVSDPTTPVEVGNIETMSLQGPVAIAPPYIYAVTEGPILKLETPLMTSVPGASVARLSLKQNYPNPFNPSTTIGFEIPTRSMVRIDIFDVRGQLVRSLLDGVTPAGPHSIEWNGRDGAGNAVGSGVYFYRLRADGATQTKKMVLLK